MKSSNMVQVTATGDVTTDSAVLRAVVLTADSTTSTAVIRKGGSGGTTVLTLSAAAGTSAAADLYDALCEDGIHVTLAGTGAVATVVYA